MFGLESMFWPLLVCLMYFQAIEANSLENSVGKLTETASWCSCRPSSHICNRSAGRLRSCARTNLPIYDPKPVHNNHVRNISSGRETACAVKMNGWRKCTLLHLVSGPVPWGVPVRGSLQVAKLDLICRVEAVHSHRKLHLEELVRLRPGHLRSRGRNAF